MEIASLLCVSKRTVWHYIVLFRQTGDIELQRWRIQDYNKGGSICTIAHKARAKILSHAHFSSNHTHSRQQKKRVAMWINRPVYDQK